MDTVNILVQVLVLRRCVEAETILRLYFIADLITISSEF